MKLNLELLIRNTEEFIFMKNSICRHLNIDKDTENGSSEINIHEILLFLTQQQNIIDVIVI